MAQRVIGVILLFSIVCLSANLYAQSIYELRKLTEEDWLAMSTEERLNSLSMATKHTENQTFVGDFGRYYDMYKRWGYEFYEMEDRYENYAFRGFENYNIIEERRRRWSYNDFGDRIAKMTTSGNIWKEVYKGDGTFAVEMPNRYINAMATKDADGVWVAKEATNDWAFSAIGAASIRTKFSPLTLSNPNMNGMRLDFQTANTNIAFISSSLLGSWWWNYNFDLAETNGSYPTNTQLVKKGGVLLRGGYLRRKLGALTVGASYVNQYGVQGNREGGDDWYGTVSNFTPTPIIVAIRFLDDSPNDNTGGATIFDVKLKVNGEYRPDIIPDVMLDNTTRDRTTAITKITEQEYLAPPASAKIGKPEHDFLGIEGSIPKYADYFYLKDYQKGANIKNVIDNYDMNLSNQYYQLIDPGVGPVTVNGTESAVYWFDLASIREHVNRVEAEIRVANDYNIQTSLIYTKDTSGGHDTAGKIKTYYDATYWKTMAQAEGNIQDNSNITQLSIDFGVQVASIIYGLDFDFNYLGFNITGEFVTNSSHYMFPDDLPGTGFPTDIVSGQTPRTGHKWAELDHAYFVTAQKDWQKFGFAGEMFKMGKFYRPYMDYFYAIAGDMGYGVYAINSRNNMIRFPLIEDNDDDDQYPDTMIEQRTVGYRILSSEDPDGVFPGNDADNDGLADNNKNNNSIPDYEEPFLMFDVDRDEFVFGNDYNNNNIPDFREDDMKLDTPYELDRQGHHFSFRFTPVRSVNLIAGSFRTHGVGTDYRTNDDYFKLLLNYDVFDIGKLYAEYRYEHIQDDIRDQYIQVNTRMKENYLEPGITSTTGRFRRELYYDELEYKNSNVNRLWIDSIIRAVPAITMENHIKLEKNDQIEGVMYDTTYQPGETLTTIAMVNKIFYTKKIGNWTLMPGVKYRFYKKDRDGVSRPGDPSDYYTTQIPLIMLKYFISPRTDLMLGLQGIPGLEFYHDDFVQDENDLKQKTYLLQLQNRTNYFGYQIWASTGIKFDQVDYQDPTRNFENYKSSTTYVQILLGW
ncbi:MAG: hypothetical protein JXB48_06275 [Candidatus Latescibacteria bacterium]|nr:hypothetical protein [Candidatus Latescibacterota bacterium]